MKTLDIGAADGSFLRMLREQEPRTVASAVEPDLHTQSKRTEMDWLTVYGAMEEVATTGRTFDRVCAFHVLEHIQRPEDFLRDCGALLEADGLMILEVPSIDDPLLSIYDCGAYKSFYYQTQHPYNYSMASLAALVQDTGFRIVERINHQRYGLENHLTWLSKGVPGGAELFRSMFGRLEGDYRGALERAGKSDAAIVICSRQ